GLFQLVGAQPNIATEDIAQPDEREWHRAQGSIADRFADLHDPIERALHDGLRGRFAVQKPLEGDERVDASDELEIAELFGGVDEELEAGAGLPLVPDAIARAPPPTRSTRLARAGGRGHPPPGDQAPRPTDPPVSSPARVPPEPMVGPRH